jgi:glycosyltransferase involved in cell wall biosynthesis
MACARRSCKVPEVCWTCETIRKIEMKVLIITDSPYLYTGLARVNRHMIRGLSENGHEVFVGAWGWDQEAYPKNEEHKWVYKDEVTGKEHTAFPLQKNPHKLIAHTYEVAKFIEPDVIITVGDYWNFPGFDQLKAKLSYSFKWIAYYTIEAEPINEVYIDPFKSIDVIATPSKFGKEVVEQSTGMKCHHIPYGIDHDSFYRLDDETIAKERSKRNLDGKFRFINVSKNINRKNIPAFLEALKRCNDADDSVVGYLHSNIKKSVDSMVNIENLIKRFQLEGILLVPENKISIDLGRSDDQLNVEYNCSDALVLSSVAEGFGLPIIEAQKCGVMPIVTNSSAMSELVEGRGELVNSIKYHAKMEQIVNIIDVDDLFEKMMSIVDKKKKQKKLFMERSKKNIEFAKGFRWETMNREIAEIVGSQKRLVSVPVELI